MSYVLSRHRLTRPSQVTEESCESVFHDEVSSNVSEFSQSDAPTYRSIEVWEYDESAEAPTSYARINNCAVFEDDGQSLYVTAPMLD